MRRVSGPAFWDWVSAGEQSTAATSQRRRQQDLVQRGVIEGQAECQALTRGDVAVREDDRLAFGYAQAEYAAAGS